MIRGGQPKPKRPAQRLVFCWKLTVLQKRLFRHCFQATGANIFANFLPTFVNRRTLNIRLELPFCLFLRETDILPEHWLFATNITFSHNLNLNLTK